MKRVNTLKIWVSGKLVSFIYVIATLIMTRNFMAATGSLMRTTLSWGKNCSNHVSKSFLFNVLSSSLWYSLPATSTAFFIATQVLYSLGFTILLLTVVFTLVIELCIIIDRESMVMRMLASAMFLSGEQEFSGVFFILLQLKVSNPSNHLKLQESSAL